MFCTVSFFEHIHQAMEPEMELECAKYGEKMDAEQAVCRHPGDYCQHRKSCMIQFMERENRGNNQPAQKTEESHNE
ncbi:MAG: hypothetical protein D3904_17180 [Candidatus Electrothrix sp. EH2]|nr:hypothetical protein [Candidatus Electrothrix sp. EH2]